ncbi:MAG: hypothetical protein ACOC9H_01720 [Gemmatimonadota bacterium]
MIDSRMRQGLLALVLAGTLAAFTLSAGCARQVEVQSGPSDSDTTDADTSSLVIEADRAPAFDPEGAAAVTPVE